MMEHQKSGSTLSFFEKLVHNEIGQEVDQNHITSFFQKSLSWQVGHIGPKNSVS